MKKVEVTKEEAQGLHEMGLEVSCRITYASGLSYFMVLRHGSRFDRALFFEHRPLGDGDILTYYVNEGVKCD